MLQNTNFMSEQGGHKPAKLREFEKLSESQGNLNFCRKNLENSGKLKYVT